MTNPTDDRTAGRAQRTDPRDMLVAGVEDYLAQLDDDTFADLIARTRDPESTAPESDNRNPRTTAARRDANTKADEDAGLYRSIYGR